VNEWQGVYIVSKKEKAGKFRGQALVIELLDK
jgi:hypothetical protein